MGIKAEWTGCYPNLCTREWRLFIGGKDFSDRIPEEIRGGPMGTYGTYYDHDWDDDFGEHEDGLQEEDWIQENRDWLREITEDPEVERDIYRAFQQKDWRRRSCGGCE